MDLKACEAARTGNLLYFQSLGDSLPALLLLVDEDGRSLLHTACTSPSPELVQLLADRAAAAGLGHIINAADEEGWTPLMSAVSCGQEQAAAFLISQGADIKAQNSGGRTALHYAASKGYVALLRLLLQSGAKVGARDTTGSTPLHRAASAGKQAAVQVLVEEGNARPSVEFACAPLMLAMWDGVNPSSALSPNLVWKDGPIPPCCLKTPLFVSAESGHPQVALYLVSKGANLQAANKEGATPLSVADSELRRAIAGLVSSRVEEEDDGE